MHGVKISCLGIRRLGTKGYGSPAAPFDPDCRGVYPAGAVRTSLPSKGAFRLRLLVQA